MEKELKRMITIKRAADITGISYDYIRKLCLSGNLPHIRCGSKYLLNYDGFIAYVGKLEEQSLKKTNRKEG